MEQTARKKRNNFLYNIGMGWRIFIYLLGFTIIMLLLLWVFQIIYLNDFYESIKKQQIETAAQSISLHLGDEDMEQHTQELALEYNICASIYLLHTHNDLFFGMEEKATADVLGDCIIHHLGSSDIAGFYYDAQEAEQQGEKGYMEIYSRLSFGGSNIYSSSVEENEGLSKSLVYATIRQDNDGGSWLVLLNSSITPVAATVSTLRMQLRIVSAVVLIMALIVSFMIARRLSNPISKLNRAAKKLAKGDFAVKFPAKGYKEIAELADTLNYAGSEIARTDKLQKDLVANISHDIRTPLTMIGGYAEYMRDFPQEDHSDSIQVIIDETQRLRELVNDILDNSRIMSGVSTLEKSDFDINASVAAFVSNYDLLLEPKGCRAIYRGTDAPLIINADEKRITQALSNLMNNAAAHIGKDKQILVTLQKLEQPAEGGRYLRRSKNTPAVSAVRISVADHGCGIDAKELPHIWERYYHADSPAGSHGSGLGLSIVRGIMELHNGRYGVESVLGEGSTFWLELDLNDAPAETEEK